MVRRNRGPMDPNVASLIIKLRKASAKNEAPIWRSISKKLQKPRRIRSQVNVSKINRYSKEDEFVIIAGKVLGSGELGHAVSVAALSFSEGAKSKIVAAKGRTMSIADLMDENPKGSGVRILG